MLLIIKTPDFQHIDERGSLIQLVHEGQKQINYVFSKAGEIRGNHFHQQNTETFYVISGCFKLVLEKADEKEAYEFRAGDMFQVLPGVRHTFEYLEDTQLIGMYDQGVELQDGGMDIHN